MLKTYPVDFVERKRMVIMRSLLTGLIGVILFFVADVFKGNVFFVGLAGVVSLGALTVFLWAVAALIGIEWCDGDVLEVEDDTVLVYRENPFFYDVKSLGTRSLVPLRFGKKVETMQTLRVAMRDHIFSCELHCVVVLSNFQRFYSAFLWNERRIKSEPKSVVNACLATFLHQQRANILNDFHRDESIPAQKLTRTQEDAQEYLRSELDRFGLMVDSVMPKPNLQASFVE